MDIGVVSGQQTLDSLRKGERGVVIGVVDTDPGMVSDVAHSTIGRRLLELGFVPGEPVEIVAAAWPGADPLAVRVGASVFALRRREARAVLVGRLTAGVSEPA